MQSKSWLRFTPLKLHTRTTILTSAVLVAVFAVIAYFSDLAITKLSDQQERQQARAAKQQIETSKVTAVRQQGQTRLISAKAAINVLEDAGPIQLGTVSVLLSFDENQSSAARLRRLMWPLMLLAIVAVTLMT